MGDPLKFTLIMIRKRLARSLLTVLQIGLGVWITSIVVSINLQGTGALDRLGSFAKISVANPAENVVSNFAPPFSTRPRFTSLDLAKLRESEHIADAFLYSRFGWWYGFVLADGSVYQVSSGARSTPGYARAIELDLVEGDFFTELDVEQKSQVILISEIMKNKVFPDQSALGKTIVLKDERSNLDVEYKVIGVYKRRTPLLRLWVSDDQFILPLENQKPHGAEWFYTEIFIKSEPGHLYQAAADAQLILAHRAEDGMEVQVAYFQDYDVTYRSSIRKLSYYLGFMAFLSVLVSGIGLLGTMLVSVMERSKEVGLRKALGAPKWSIIVSTLADSLILVAVGSVLGLVAAYVTAPDFSARLAQVYNLDGFGEIWNLHPKAAIYSVALMVGAAMFFGLYPALILVRMSAVEALREVSGSTDLHFSR